VKQWQKLIQLGLEHMFHAVTISEETGSEALTTDTLRRTFEKLPVNPERSIFVGCDRNEIAVANSARMITVRVKTGANRTIASKRLGKGPHTR
jgi:putative hydrolase of the HAD superfamily